VETGVEMSLRELCLDNDDRLGRLCGKLGRGSLVLLGDLEALTDPGLADDG